MSYYDGTKLLSMLDINSQKPEIYLCTTNRSAGKTTWFGRYMVKKFLEKGEKFCLIYRYNYELDDIANKFFKEINSLFFQDYEMESKRRANGIFHELFLNGDSCGYAVSLNSSDNLKKYSHLFSDTARIFFDEFQSENNHYCADEITKFISVHTTIARGGGKQCRYVPVFMCGNCVSILNPYYIELGIASRLKNDTKFLRGEGYVLEQGFNESASSLQQKSAFNRAFTANSYIAYSTQNVYLNDNSAFIDRPTGKSKYLCTFKYNGREYAIREYTDNGVVYCDYNVDKSFKAKLCVNTDDHQINYIMLKNNEFFISQLRYLFNHGCFRFKDLKCKEALLKIISY